MTPYTLTDWQARALSEDRLSLLIEPLPVQPGGYDIVVLLSDTAYACAAPDGTHMAGEYPLPHAVGDRLWCREKWDAPFAEESRMAGEPTEVFYRVDGGRDEWQPADTMPQWASRFTLEVVAVAVKRLQDVTGEEARAAGYPGEYGTVERQQVIIRAPQEQLIADQFSQPPHAWADNPWCAFTEVKKI